MPVHVDLAVINNAATQGDWNTVDFDPPQLNDQFATTPLYIEGNAAMFWALKKGTTNGHTYTNVISGTPSLTGKVLVGWLNFAYADIANIPISSIFMRVSSATTFTTNYGQWNARSQILAPKNTAISGHTPIMIYPTNPDGSNGTPNYGTVQSVGWVATTGGSADGKYGGFDWMFIIGWLGAHSATYTNTWFSSMALDATPATIPGTTSRPLGVFSRAGDFYRSNVSLRAGHGASDTANTVISETGKTTYFDNLQPEQELGFDLVNPSGANTLSFTLIGHTAFWNDQPASAEIFIGAENADTFKIEGGSYSRGGQINLPPDNVNRWVRGVTFAECRAGSASDGECTNTVFNTCDTMAISGDADFVGSQFLTSSAGVDAAALEWNGNFDPNTKLADTVFTKGAAAHHAIEFGTASPLTMTLTGIDFSGFNALNAQNDSTFYIKRTSGTVTINLVGTTGNVSYKTDGATVVIQSPTVLTLTGVPSGVQATIVNSSTRVERQNTVSTGADITYNYTTVETVDILFMANAFDPSAADIYDFVLPSVDSSIPVSIPDDPNYVNPP